MSIREVARRAKVSITTVSRVLNERPGVSPDTRARILRVMDEMDYHPATVVHRARILGVVLTPRPNPFQSEYVAELLSGIADAAFSSGYELIVLPIGDLERSESSVKQYCRVRRVSGLLVVAPLIGAPLISKLSRERFPYIVLSSSYKNRGINWIDVDNEAAAFEAVEHLVRLGHRRIGLLNSSVRLQCFIDRARGYRSAMERYGLEVDEGLVIDVPPDIDAEGYLASKLAYIDPPPTALFATSYIQALKAIDTLKARGLNIPEDISIVGFGDYHAAPYTSPPLTTIHQPVEELGRRAVENLLNLIEGEVEEPIQISLKADLIVRGSTKGARL
ncbi:MAG: LacI family DNA-binding transcriptional regulator [bacterium]